MAGNALDDTVDGVKVILPGLLCGKSFKALVLDPHARHNPFASLQVFLLCPDFWQYPHTICCGDWNGHLANWVPGGRTGGILLNPLKKGFFIVLFIT